MPVSRELSGTYLGDKPSCILSGEADCQGYIPPNCCLSHSMRFVSHVFMHCTSFM